MQTAVGIYQDAGQSTKRQSVQTTRGRPQGMDSSKTFESQAKVVTLDTEFEKDMKFRAVDKKLTRILTIMAGFQVMMAAAKRLKKRNMKHLDHLMDIINDKKEEAKEYKRIRDQREYIRLQEVSN